MRINYYLNALPVPLSMSIWLQKIMDSKAARELCFTHKFCNMQTVALLQQFSDKRTAAMVQKNMEYIQNGVVWADLNFKNIMHFYDPFKNKGLWKFSPAVVSFEFYLDKAERFLKKRNMDKSFFYLGAAIHLLQDMSVPHHVSGDLFNGHKKFEEWVQLNLHQFVFFTDIKWRECKNPIQLFMDAAYFATNFISLVDYKATVRDYFSTANILLLETQKNTASLLEWFVKKI